MDGVKVEEKVKAVKVNLKKVEEVKENKKELAEEKLTLKQRKVKKWEKRMKNQPVCVTLEEKSKKPDYFKKLLPDDEQVNFSTPRTISVVDHAENASKEIKSMMKVLSKKSGSATAMQTLPIHMRRRAASHNNKRLPRTVREAAKQNNMFMPSDNKIKKACRKKRRAKVLLQNEYSKRAGKAGWLETHLWHAKRFKVTQSDDLQYKYWGCRIPLHPTFKNYRACYAGMSKKCNIQDVSYLKCLTVQATEEAVDKIVDNITLKSDKQDKLKKLGVEVELMVYDHNLLSPVCVGPGLFSKLQNPKTDRCNNSEVHLMIWLHPTILEQVTRLIEIFDASCSYKIRELCRFKLVGPKSSVMLLSTLTSYLLENDQNHTDNRSMSLKKWISNNNNLVKEQNQKLRMKLAEAHRSIFKRNYEKSKESLEVEEGQIFSAIVDDPRLRMPLLKTKAKLNGKLQQEPIKFTATPDAPVQGERAACESCSIQTPLLDEAVCEEICKSRLNDCKVSSRKNQAKLCGDDLQSEALLNSLSTPIPLLVIAKTGYNSTNTTEDGGDTVKKVKNLTHRGPSDKFAPGYDIILPPGWSMPFWISFIYHQAMPTAQREHKRIAMECRTPHFPEDFPDTYAGAYYWHFQSKKNLDEFYRHSPNNRVNHSVLAVPHPFAPNWKSLFTKQQNTSSSCPAAIPTNGAKKRKLDGCEQLTDESTASTSKKIKVENQNSQVLTIEKTSIILGDTKKKPAEDDNNITSPSFRVLRDETILKQLANILARDDGLESLKQFVAGISESTLVCFQLLSMNKGKPTENCSISLPCSADLGQLKAEIDDLYGKGLTNCKAPVEPTHKDPLRNERKEDSKQRKKNRKKTKSQRVSLPPVTNYKSFPVMPSKETIGFVTSGGFSNSFAKGVGIGFVNIKNLVSLYKIRCDSSWLKEKVFDEMCMPPTTLFALHRPTNDFVYRYILLKLYSK